MFLDNLLWRGPLFDEKTEGDGTSTEETTEETSEETEETGEETEEEESSDVEDLDEIGLKEAKNLYLLLKSPETRNATLQILAERAGILKPNSPAPTEKEVKKDTKTVLAILEESLGTELKWLAPKLEKAFTEILSQKDEEFSGKFATVEERELARETSDAFAKLAAETKGASKKFEARIAQLTDEILPAPGMSAYKYTKYLYNIALAEQGGKVVERQVTDKINRNAKDAASRLHSQSTGRGQDKGAGKGSGTKMSLREAVAFAADKLENQRK